MACNHSARKIVCKFGLCASNVCKYGKALYMFSIIQKIMKDMGGLSRLMHEILEVPGIIYET